MCAELYLKDSSCSFLLKEFAKKLCKFLTDFYAAERLTRGFLWCDLFFLERIAGVSPHGKQSYKQYYIRVGKIF